MKNMKQIIATLVLMLITIVSVSAQSISPTSLSYASPATSGQVLTITAMAGTPWLVTHKPTWMAISSPPSGTGSGTITVTGVSNNPSLTDSRSDVLTITFNGSASTSVTITQQPTPAAITLSETTKTIPYTVASYTFDVTSDADWNGTTSSTGDWLRFGSAGGTYTLAGTSGVTTVTYYVDNNTGSTSRTGTITITAGVTTVTLTITQGTDPGAPAPTLVVASNSVEFDYNQTSIVDLSQQVDVESNDTWNISFSDASWLDLSGLSNQTTFNGDETLAIVPASVNNGSTDRTVTITLTCGGITVTITLTQKAETVTTGLFGSSSTQAEDFVVYPNPSTGSFNVKSTNVKSIRVFNEMGTVISSETIETEQNFNLPTGVYFVEVIKNNDRRAVKKLIVI